ncbi:MAG: twin-arginine translocase TatA/TatE family subunit [Acidobacteria bacterium]|nr:twin-arginine translocase TatA/TatE family subunit [Acidobacteriota bacterium]
MGLGMPEVILILVVALIIFGPRKLPELGKSLGQAMSQFRRASDDFKRTWEQEVEIDKYRNSSIAGSSSSSDYSASNDYNSTYNPYSGEYESSDASTGQSLDEQVGASTEVAEPAKVEAPAIATATTAEPKQQHWI